MKIADRISGPDCVDRPHMIVHAKLGNVALDRETAAYHYRTGLDIARKLHQLAPNDPKAIKYLANCLNFYGLLRLSPGDDHPQTEDLQAAEKMLEEAKALRESLCAQDPANRDFKRGLAISFDNLGELRLLRQNRPPEAQPSSPCLREYEARR